MSDDKLEKTCELSSVYDELCSTTQQREQELQSISQLLEGIRQLQAAQQDDEVVIDEDAEPAVDGAAGAACNTAAEQLQHLQQALLLQSERVQTAPANGRRFLGAGRPTGNMAVAAAAVLASADEQTWPQTALVRLLSEANNSGSTKGNALCGASSGSSSSPSSRMAAQQTIAQVQHQSDGQALSMFSFAAGATPAALKYITPVKIPRPVRPRSTRCSNIDSNSGDSSSIESSCSRQGSYVGDFHQGEDKALVHTGAAAADDVGVYATGAATRSHSNSNWQKPASPAAHPAAAGAAQPFGAWQTSARPSPKLTPTSSTSTEAAALMLALRAAAQQREAAQEVLQARSSIATTALTHGALTPGGAPADWACSDYRTGNTDRTEQRKVLQDVHNLVTSPAAAANPAAAACNRTVMDGAKEAEQEQQQGAQHKQQQGVRRTWSPGSASPTQQHSVVGPRVQHSSSSNSVYRSQRAAVDQLMQEAVESSSMSSLMALLDSQAVSDDEEVTDTAAGAAAATPHEVVGPAGFKVSAAHTWGTDSVIRPGSIGNSSRSSPQTGGEAAGGTAGNSWRSQQPQRGQLHQHQQYLSQQQQQASKQHPQEKHRYTLNSTADSALSGGTSELQYDVLSAELEMLSSQVEQERQQLQQLQHQRQIIEQESPHSAGPTAAPAAPQHQHQLQQDQQLQYHRATPMTGLREHKQALRRSRSCGHLSAATSTDCQSLLHGAGGHQQAASCQHSCIKAAAHRRIHATVHAHVQTEAALTQHVSAPANDASTQAGSEGLDTTAGCVTAEVGCQALLLHVSGLSAVGPPAACRVCPDLQQQLDQLQQKLEKAQEQHKQAQMSAEQSRHQAMIAESQLALSRQKLRAVLSANAKPLAMSGWEDLIEEAAADLEKIEGYVSTAAERLIELQAASTSAAEALVSAQRENERQHVAAATAALKTTELQQQAEGLVAAISSNEHCKEKSNQQLQALQQQMEQHQAAATAAEQQLHELQQQLQETQQQVAAAEQQLTEKERGQQQLIAELSEKQHQLQITRGDCASAQDRLSQLQTSLVEARQQLADLQQQHQQQQRQHEETAKQLTALQSQRTGAGAEAASAQQELDRVLRELEQCQKDIQAAELQQAELDEATAEQHRLQEQHSKAAAVAAKQREKLEADVAAAQEELKQLQQQAQAAKHEADLCTSAAAAADRQLAQVQQTLGALQAGTAHAAGHRSAAVADASSAAASAAAAATAHLAECAQLQVKLAAAESRRQLAEERAEQSDRKLQQLKTELNNLHSQHDSAERQLRLVTVKCEKLKEKLKEKCESLTDVQNQLQQAQMQLQILRQTAAAAAAGSAAQQDARVQQQADSQAVTAAAAQAEAQKLVKTYQQQLGDLEADVTFARTQLQQAEQQLEQQWRANSSLQQQLATAQQQLVHAQQQLLEVRSQYSAGALSQQQQADQMHLAVRSSIQGLHEAFGLQSKLQQAQMQAESAKQQLQELQQEKKQLQKKLAAYKQQLTELKSVYDCQQVLLQQQHQQHQQTSSADSAHGPASGSSAAAGQLEELQQQLKEQREALSSELSGVQQQLADCQHQLQWANRETEHLKQLLEQQQEISNQLRVEVQRLHQQQPQLEDKTRLVMQCQACQTVAECDMQCSGLVSAAAVDAASQLQRMQTDLAAATEQLAQATAEAAAAQQDLRNVQHRLHSMEHLQQQQVQQQAQQLANAQQQLHQKESEVSAKAQQLVQQQQEHKWQQVQWEQQLQAAVQQAGQELLECRAEVANSQAALQQLVTAAVALEKQVVAAVEAAQQNAAWQAASDNSTMRNSRGHQQAQVTAANVCSDSQPALALAHAAQLVKHLAEACTAALDANVRLQQQLETQQKQAEQQLQQHIESNSSQLQQLVKAVETAQSHRQEAELLQLQLQQECQLLRMQQQQQDKQTQLPGHMQSVASVLDMMEHLHAVTQQSIFSSAAAWGTSSCGVLRGSTVPPGSSVAAVPVAAAVSHAGGTTLTTPAVTPQMSLEALEGLMPPASCLSPEIAAVGAAATDVGLRPTVARGLQYGAAPGVSDPVAAAAALQPGTLQHSQAAGEAAELHQRLVQLVQGILPQLQNAGTLQHHGHGAPSTASSLQQPAAVVGSCSAAAGLAGVVLADAELQKSWQALQEQAAGHDKLMQHTKYMWLQVVTLAQHCMALQQATAEKEESQRQHPTQQAAHQQQQHQQQSVASPKQSPELQAENGSGSSNMQQSPCVSTTGSPAQPAAAAEVVQTLLAAMQPLLVVAQQLQQDVAELANDNKQLLEAAKKVCSSFRSGGRTVRVRALALKLDLQQHGLPWGDDADGAATATAKVAATAGVTHSGLPSDVAASVVQHWNEVETLLAQLHQACEALLHQQPVAAGKQQQQHSGRASGGSSNSTRRHAVRRSKRLVEDLQRVMAQCQQRQHPHQHQIVPATQQLPVQIHRHSSPAVVARSSAGVRQEQASSSRSADSRSRSPEAQQQQATAGTPLRQHKGSARQQAHHPQQQQEQKEQQSLSLLPSSSPSCSSSCSSDGLGSLLAMVKDRLAAQSAAVTPQILPFEGGGVTFVEQDTSRQKHQHAFGSENRESVSAPQLPRLAAAAFHDPANDNQSGGTLGSKAGREQLTQHHSQLARQAAGPVQSNARIHSAGKQGSLWAQVEAGTSASLRRAERVVLLERLKLLQQQQ